MCGILLEVLRSLLRFTVLFWIEIFIEGEITIAPQKLDGKERLVF